MNILRTTLLVSATAAALHAQTVQPGYSSQVVDLPADAQAVCDVVGLGAVYYRDGRIVLDDGDKSVTLYAVPGAPMFASFSILVDDAIVFGESSSGGVYRIPLLGGAPTFLATLALNYDAVPFGDHVLVSAKTGGFPAPDNEIVALDPTTGATTVVATIPGFSGPVTTNADQSRVYYGATAGALIDIVSFTGTEIEATIAGAPVLTLADATLEHAGLPSAVSIAVDDDGDFLVSDYTGPSVIEVSRDLSGDAELTVVDYSGGGPQAGKLVYRGLLGHGFAFEPFQPAIGVGKSLTIAETDFFSTTRLRILTPDRAALTPSSSNPIPNGPFSMTMSGAAPNGAAAVLIALQAAINPVIQLPVFEQPLAFGVDLGAVVVSVPVTLDGTGTGATSSLVNPGFGRSFAFQGLFFDTSGPLPVAGTTNAVVADFQ